MRQTNTFFCPDTAAFGGTLFIAVAFLVIFWLTQRACNFFRFSFTFSVVCFLFLFGFLSVRVKRSALENRSNRTECAGRKTSRVRRLNFMLCKCEYLCVLGPRVRMPFGISFVFVLVVDFVFVCQRSSKNAAPAAKPIREPPKNKKKPLRTEKLENQNTMPSVHLLLDVFRF